MVELARESILVMDDDKDILSLFKDTLEEDGYKVVAVSTGRDAVTRAQEEQIHVAILDIIMHDVTGDSVAVELKRINDLIKIIFISGYSRIQDSINALNLGVSEILIKPVTAEELLHAVKLAILTPPIPK
ncbi:response regulator [Candidatus Bathyarchaeota archaeon]|nr:MAG: response regulator [Candidatus Bathyarchaeota archaeon]